MTKVDRIIEKFGGVRALARKLPGTKDRKALSPGTISHWRRVGYIPQPRVKDILALAEKEGIKLSAEDFYPRAA